MRKRIVGATAALVMALGLTGCQKSPDSSIVKNKDLDKLVEQAQDAENGGSDVSSVAANYDAYQTTIKDDSFHVTVNVDAKVDIPSVDSLSVLRVSQKDFTQAFLDKTLETLIGDKKLYHGGALDIRTRSDIENDIQGWKDEIKTLEEEHGEDSLDPLYQERLAELEEAYKHAPAEAAYFSYPSDGKMQSVAQEVQSSELKDYFEWQNSLQPDADIYFGVTDNEDGFYEALYMQNSSKYGNMIHYQKSRAEYAQWSDRPGAVIGPGARFTETYDPAFLIWNAAYSDTVPEELKRSIMSDEPIDWSEDTAETTTISEDEARKQADDLLAALSLTDYQYYEGGLYYEFLANPFGSSVTYGKRYILRYMRNVDGAVVSYAGQSKFEEGWKGDEYVKKFWPEETLIIRISDDGIVGFDFTAPLQIEDTVVEKSALKSFDEVKNTFEQMITVTNAQNDDMEQSVEIDISRVTLSYARISEQDSYDKGLLVPVWDFMGSKKILYGDIDQIESPGSQLTINAIDGTIVNRALGY